ncbi:uncharacterized protein CBL_10464 [Carabus blaptoides fortunei]
MKTRESGRIMEGLLWFMTISCVLSFVLCEDTATDKTDQPVQQNDDTAQSVKDSRGLFAPRMDYEQWKPLGRGDPLKNDPTYDYVPPVLDRVHYWIDPASRKPDPPNAAEMKKTEILVLGVSSKKPSTGFATMADTRRESYDPFLQFVDGPNYNVQSNYQRAQRPQYGTPQTYYPSSFYKNKPDHKEPYTMLVPPPMPTHHDQPTYQQPVMSSTSTTTPVSPVAQPTTPTVAIEEANLVYQSSSLATTDEWKGSNTYATIAESSSQVTWRTPTPEAPMNKTQKTMQQLPTVRAPETFKETVSFSIVPSIQPSMNVLMKPMAKLQNSKNLGTDIIVASDVPMHKGQVTDDILDLSSTYVSIMKPDSQMQPVTGMGVDVIPMSRGPMMPMKPNNLLLNSPLASSVMNPVISSAGMYRKPHPSAPVKKLEMLPMTLQTMQTMQTMQPPPVTRGMSMVAKKPLPLLHSLLKKESTTTFAPPTTTSVASLTTDPLFKHYKQPAEPLRGPMYLIIQGHSKVKTYGPSKQINGISVQESNEIPTSDDRQTEYPVKHLHELMKENREEWDRERRDSRSGRLQTLNHVVLTGLGAMDFKDAARRNDEEVKETQLIAKYDVSSGEDVTSELYHKGFVESEAPPYRKDRH